MQKDINLLTLENLLAESVDAVVMCIESEGSIAELGAFSNFDKLKDKLIVYMNIKYKRENSFINIGPVKFLELNTKSKVIWKNFEEEFEGKDRYYLITSIREIKSQQTIQSDLSNPLFAQRFLLALFYVTGACDKNEIINIIKSIQTINLENIIVDSSLAILRQRGAIVLNYPNYEITKVGIEILKKELTSKFVYQHLDKIRIKMINYLLRKHRKKRGS